LRRIGESDRNAQRSILGFLGWEEPDDGTFAVDTKIVLVSLEFSKEITTTVLWLNKRQLDIRCVRLRPYCLDGRILLDVQQVIPLPEAAEYQVQLRKKEAEQRESQQGGAWNGEYYVSFGPYPESRNWEDAMKYGFISGGGGAWFTKTLDMLEPGSRIWFNVPHRGYVGVGVVKESAKAIKDFLVTLPDGREMPLLQVGHKSPSLAKNLDELVVRVDWSNMLPIGQAVSEPGFFGNQNTVARPKSSKWNYTIQVLKKKFGVD
jgi:hypothetical protein